MLGGSIRKSDARPRRALHEGQRTDSSSANSAGTLNAVPQGLHFHSGGDGAAAAVTGLAAGFAAGWSGSFGGNFRRRVGRLGFSVISSVASVIFALKLGLSTLSWRAPPGRAKGFPLSPPRLTVSAALRLCWAWAR